MAHEVVEIKNDVVSIRLSGLLQKVDMTALQELALQLIGQGKRLRLLAIIENFQGWDKKDDWNDIGFLMEHGDDFVKMAFVGDEKWKDDAFLFAGKGFRSTEIEFFPPTALRDAERWVQS